MATAAKILGVAPASVSKVCGVAKASIKYVIGVGLAAPITILDSYSESNYYDASNYMSNGRATALGQKVYLASAKTITSFKFYLAKAGSPTGNVVGKLRDPANSYAELASSGNVSVTTLSTSHALVEFTLTTPYSASSGNIVLAAEYSGSGGEDYVKFGVDGTSPAHSGTCVRYDSVWYDRSSDDAIFYLYGY